MNKNKIRIGDVLYEPSVSYNRVIEHKIVDMYIENYISGWKTIVVTESYLGKQNNFATDVLYWCSTEEDAEKALAKSIPSYRAILKTTERYNGNSAL